MFRFEKLEVWKLAMEYAQQIYDLTEKFPKQEQFSLTSQIKRAVLSISSNIAEGSGSNTNKDFCNFLDIAIKSTIETVSQLFFAKERGYITEKEIYKLYENAEVLVKRIQTLKSYLRNKK